ncbi:MAG: hypothetical protein U5K69_27865 [Balneolaceae bacterium]|nr:hypothetical protein [Balneolaceae bacterium]
MRLLPLNIRSSWPVLKAAFFLAFAGLFSAACSSEEPSSDQQQTTEFGGVEVLDQRVTELIDSTATIEVLGEGYEWSEGPVWGWRSTSFCFSPTSRII